MSGLEAKLGDLCIERYGSLEPSFNSIPIDADGKGTLTPLSSIQETADIGKRVTVRARLHNIRGTSKAAFLVLRQNEFFMQAVLFKSEEVSVDMVKFASHLTRESIVDISGEIVSGRIKSEQITFKSIELRADYLRVISRADETLPFQVDDAARAEEASEEDVKKEAATPLPRVNLDTRLNNRIVDLRTPSNQAIFRLQSAIVKLGRRFLESLGFMEIHSPKLISAASEGGANVFQVTYFKTSAFLAQSPQFYKQMAICADFPRVFEVGPVFRAENSFTHRHMTEFTGFDIEMVFDKDYHEVVLKLAEMLMSIFRELASKYSAEIELVRAQYASQDFVFLEEPLILSFSEGIALLREAGVEQLGDFEDLSTENERCLGRIVREKYNTDFYILDKFPSAIRPFYTMKDPADPRFSHSYDFFMRGEEILSGAQRCHDYNQLLANAAEHAIDPVTIQGYLDAFKFGAAPHAGGGIGLERVLMLFLGLKNIRKASMFPRDPNRITP